ncbi:aldo/keto reductase [Streptomyces sp. NBC_01591]|nr:aldo/keto reductase [Streptomyces sp. NBC_01591]
MCGAAVARPKALAPERTPTCRLPVNARTETGCWERTRHALPHHRHGPRHPPGGECAQPRRHVDGHAHRRGDLVRDPGTRARQAALRAVAEETGATVNQVVLAWLIGGEIPFVPLVGASSVAQLDESLAAVDLELTAEQRAALDAAH